MQVEFISNHFGRPYLDDNHHRINVGFKITGGSGSYQYRRVLFGNTTGWTDVETTTTETNNEDGYIINTHFFHGTIGIEIADKNNAANFYINPSFELFYNNELTALPIGDTPIIVNSSLAVGATSITVKTRKQNSFVRLWKSTYSQDPNGVMGQNFQPTSKPISVGITDLSGDIVFTIPSAVAGDRYIASAQSFFDFESFTTNYIEVGGSKKTQLTTTLTYGSVTGTGRNITVNSVTGGTGSYSIGLLNNGIFDKSVGTSFEIPFGFSNIYVKDNGSTDRFVSVAVDGGTATTGTIYTGNLRSKFSESSNPNGVVKFGTILTDNSFVLLDNFATRDRRRCWGKAGFDFPQVGVDDTGLATSRVFLHPCGGYGSLSVYQLLAKAAIRYTCEGTGVLRLQGDSLRPLQTNNFFDTNNPRPALDDRFQILLNGVVKYTVVHTVQNQVVPFDITIDVANGDFVDFAVDSGDFDENNGDMSFDHVHIGCNYTLSTTGQGITPTAPRITTLTPQGIGTDLVGDGNQVGDYVIMYLNNYPYSLARITGNGTGFVHGAMEAGTWRARISRNKILSDLSNAIVVNVGATLDPTPPIPDVTSIAINNAITGTAPQAGTIRVYEFNSSVVIAYATTSGANNAWSYTPTSQGVYRFKLENQAGQLSGYSANVTVNLPVVSGIPIMVESEIFGESCQGQAVEYAYSDTITDITSSSLAWSQSIIIPYHATLKFFARLVEDHNVHATTPFTNTELFSKTVWTVFNQA